MTLYIFIKQLIYYVIKELIAFLLFIPVLVFLKYSFTNKKVYYLLNYHNFSKYNNYRIKRGNILETEFASNFDKQIKFLKEHFNFYYPEEFYREGCKKGLNILITFDDGYKDNYKIAFPILKKYHAKCIFFIVTNYIGTKKWLWHDKVRYLIYKGKLEESLSEKALKQMNQGNEVPILFKNKIDSLFRKEVLPELMMNWEEVYRLSEAGFKIGTHTASHKILSLLNFEDQKKEIEESITMLNGKLKVNSNDFAYPNGLFNKDTLEILKQNKINYAYSTKAGLNTQSQDKLQIRRIGINASDSISVLLLKIVLNNKR